MARRKAQAPYQPPPGYAPGGQYQGQTQSFGQPAGLAGGFMAPIGATPPRALFINGLLIHGMGGSVRARIIGVRPPTGGRADIQQKPQWFVDFDIKGKVYTGRVSVGDVRHATLWARFQDRWVGQEVEIRLPTPADNTKAAWVIS